MRSNFINICGYAGDISVGKSRKDCYSAYFLIKGGEGAVKVQTCDTINGEYSDYKVLIENADAETIKGVFCMLDGAKEYIKVTGADIAEVIFGDCDFDPAKIVPTMPEISLKYKLYAYCVSIHDDTIGYAEKEEIEVGDVILTPDTTGAGPITDTDELTKAGVITEVNTSNIKVTFDGGSTEVVFERDSQNDFTDKVTEVQGAIDVSENGVVTAESGTVYKSINVNVETEESE